MFIRMPAETIRTTYALRSETVRKLDRLAKRWHTNRSEALRRVIDRVDEEESLQERISPLMALEAMREVPQGEQEAWRRYGEDLRTQRQADDDHRGF